MDARSADDRQALGVSVVLCTYNRADLLPGCLESLAAQTADRGAFEVIVVDNNSTDATREIADAFAAREPGFRVVAETAQGLSHARNRGWKEAAAPYVAYIDDDARAEPDWVARALRVIRDQAPDVFGGPIYPFYLTEKPDWYKDEYGTRLTATEPRLLREKEYISGSNLFVRRDLLAGQGGFNPDLGMKGLAQGYGEETAFLIHARRVGAAKTVFYDPDLRVRHLVPARKMRIGHMLRAALNVGRDGHQVFGRAGGRLGAATGLVRVAGTIAFRMCVRMPLRARSAQPYWQNYMREQVVPLVRQLGGYYVRLRR